MNIFDEQVFDDTEYSVCSFQFTKRHESLLSPIAMIPADIRSSNETRFVVISFSDENDFTIGGEIYKSLTSACGFTVGRLIGEEPSSTNILVKCIDDISFETTNSDYSKTISARVVGNSDIYRDTTPKKSARSYLTLTIEPKLSVEQQSWLTLEFNQYIIEQRMKYRSLFLTNYRQDGRKRVSFELVYTIVRNILSRLI